MFGVRKVFMTAEDREGIMLISEPSNETEYSASNIRGAQFKGIKHIPHDIRTLTKRQLTE